MEMDILLKLHERELYPLMEVARIERRDISALLDNLLKQWLRGEVIHLYQKGRISLWKASELLGVSLWELMDDLEQKGIPLEISRVES